MGETVHSKVTKDGLSPQENLMVRKICFKDQSKNVPRQQKQVQSLSYHMALREWHVAKWIPGLRYTKMLEIHEVAEYMTHEARVWQKDSSHFTIKQYNVWVPFGQNNIIYSFMFNWVHVGSR